MKSEIAHHESGATEAMTNTDQSTLTLPTEMARDQRSNPEDNDTVPQDISTKRAVAYIRVSTKAQAERDGNPEGYSLPTQRAACSNRAHQLGAVIVDEYIDKDSGTSVDKRPAMLTLIDRVTQERDIDYVIVHQLSRFARNRLDDASITMRLEASGATLISCMEGGIDQTASGRMLQGMLAVVNEYQSRNQGDDIKRKTLQKVKDGGTPSLAPIGYVNVQGINAEKDKRWVEVDPERAPLITWAFEEYATGKWSLAKLLAELTERGLTTRPTPKRPSQPLHLSLLQRLFTRPYYKGVVVYHGVEYPGKHIPLVSAEVFGRVQEVLTAHNVSGERHWKHEHYLKGTIFCAKCGGRLSLTHATGRGGTYVYFYCLGRKANGQSCWQKALQVELVEQRVEEFWQGVRITSVRAEELRSVLASGLDDARADAEQQKHLQQSRIAKLVIERKKLLDAYYQGAVPMDLLGSEQDRISTAMDNALRQLDESSLAFDGVEQTLNKAIGWASELPEAYRYANDKVRRGLNQAVFTRLMVCEDGVTAYEYTDGMDVFLERNPRVVPIPERFENIDLQDRNPFRFSFEKLQNYIGIAFAQGLDVMHLVEVSGLEPPTSTMRT